jgi:hypothetical protein
MQEKKIFDYMLSLMLQIVVCDYDLAMVLEYCRNRLLG